MSHRALGPLTKMKKITYIFFVWFLACGLLHAQIVQQAVVNTPAPSGSGPVDCGNTAETATLASNLNRPTGIPCTTGADANGYTVTAFYTYTGAVAGTVYAAIYPDRTSGCGDGATHCANSTANCGDTAGFTPSATTWNEDTAAAITTSCGTIAANTVIWLMTNYSSATTAVGHKTGACTAPTSSGYFTSVTAGTWPSLNGAGFNLDTNCYSNYVVLQPQ